MKKTSLLSLILLLSFFAVRGQSLTSENDDLRSRNYRLNFSGSNADRFIENLTVYPNPVIDVLKITFKSSQKSVVVISIFNNIGKQVFSQESEVDPGNVLISIDLRSKSIEPGIYFIQCVSGEEIFTRKLIVK